MDDKNEFSQKVWQRIRDQLKKRKLNQVDIVRKCREQGFMIGQSELSRLMNDRVEKQPKLTLYQAVAFSRILNIPLDELLTGKPQDTLVNVNGNTFVRDPESYAFQGFLGSFYTYFCSTDLHEIDKVLRGRLTLGKSDSGNNCRVMFKLDTGQTNTDGQNVCKIYHGDLIMSPNLGVCYMILANERIGEMSFILLRYRGFLIQQLECRLGLVLTVSAGESKTPVAHRILLSRHKLEPSVLKKVMPFLRMTEGDFLIEEGAVSNLADKHPEIEEIIRRIKSENSAGNYYSLDEAIIRRAGRRLSQMEMAELLSIMLETAEVAHNTRLTEWADSKVFDILRKNEFFNSD